MNQVLTHNSLTVLLPRARTVCEGVVVVPLRRCRLETDRSNPVMKVVDGRDLLSNWERFDGGRELRIYCWDGVFVLKAFSVLELPRNLMSGKRKLRHQDRPAR